MAFSSNSIATLLQQELGLIVQAQGTSSIQFDALLRSSADPMPLFVIEDLSSADAKAVREKCRKLESFIWNLYRAGNVNTVTAIFIVGEKTATEELISVSKRLTGRGRLFFVKRSSTRDELIHNLRPLVPPKLAEIERSNPELAAIAQRSVDILSEIEQTPTMGGWLKERLSAEGLKEKTCNEFERLMRELQNAIK